MGLIQSEHEGFEHLKRKLIFGSGWYLTHLMDMSNSTESLSHSYGDYCREFKRLFNGVDTTGKFWERVSLINPWNFYSISEDKINKIHDELENISNVNHKWLEEMKDVLNGYTGLAEYISNRNNEVATNEDSIVESQTTGERDGFFASAAAPRIDIGFYRDNGICCPTGKSNQGITIDRTKSYLSIDEAAVAAAIDIYNTVVSIPDSECEYGITIYKHKLISESILASERREVFYLTTMRLGAIDKVYPDNKIGYPFVEEFVAHVHSHPFLGEQTLSIGDIISSYDLQAICYLLVGYDYNNDRVVDEIGFVKFTPPLKNDFNNSVRMSGFKETYMGFKDGLESDDDVVYSESYERYLTLLNEMFTCYDRLGLIKTIPLKTIRVGGN